MSIQYELREKLLDLIGRLEVVIRMTRRSDSAIRVLPAALRRNLANICLTLCLSAIENYSLVVLQSAKMIVLHHSLPRP